ncbi:MAG: class I SAM-dependent methyltransferase family protein [Candidatus Odinarchaeota archaeon]
MKNEVLKMVVCLSVRRIDGEKARELLVKHGLLDDRYKIKSDCERVCFPIKPGVELKRVVKELPGAKLIDDFFEFKNKVFTRGLREVLQSYLGVYEKERLPKSYDLIGGLMLIELKEELWSERFKIGAIIKENFKHIRGVFAKKGSVEGEFRVREVECIGGDCNPVTVHLENGCRYHLDLTKVYFNSRLGSERLRVAEKISPNETVIDMFAGVGPFTILIAKKRVEVNAIDSNPDAVFYLKKNIIENRVEKYVNVFLGRAEQIVTEYLKRKADRIIMNLPADSLNYLKYACEGLKEGGGVIHLYFFSGEKDFDLKLRSIDKNISEVGYKIRQMLTRRVREIAPYRYMYCVDLTLH